MKTGISKYRQALIIILFLIAFIGAFSSAFAQETKDNKQGFWTVETNVKEKTFSIIRFYDDKGNLIYEEEIQGVNLELSAKNKKILDKTLAIYLNKKIVAVEFKEKSISKMLQ
jgi:hypothetical protein